MAPKFSLQNVLDVRQRKEELELGKLLTALQETELQLASLREVHHELLEQLSTAQSGWVRLDIAQVNQHIEDVTLQLAGIKRQVEEKRGSKSRSRTLLKSTGSHSATRGL